MISMMIFRIFLMQYGFQAIFCSEQGCLGENCTQSISVDLPLVTKLDALLKAEVDITPLHKQIRRLIQKEVQEVTRTLNLTQTPEVVQDKEVPNSMKYYGFHVQLNNDVALGRSQTVIFDKVIINIGNAYNRHTGIFTAETNGLYYFSSTFLEIGGNPLHLQMMRNKEEISRGHATNAESGTGCMNALVYLNKTDVVFVRHWSGPVGHESIHGKWSFFTGYLVRPTV